MTATTTYSVQGMTCGHCVTTVKGAIGDIPGVSGVDVDVRSGQVTVNSETDLHPADVKAAVAQAGYEVVE